MYRYRFSLCDRVLQWFATFLLQREPPQMLRSSWNPMA